MRRLTSILLLLLLCTPAHSQGDSTTEQRSETIKIYFDHNSHAIDLDLQQNRESLLRFSDLIKKLSGDTLSVVTKVEIDSYASPEGGYDYNKMLSERRSNSIYDYLTNTISIPEKIIDKRCSGIDWERLRELVEQSDMKYKDEVLYILDNTPEETWRRVNPDDRWLSLVDSRNKHLMDLKYGYPYHYMYDKFYPQLRNGSVVTLYFTRELPPVPVVEPVEVVAEVVADEPEPEPTPEPAVVAEPIVEQPTTKPLLLAIKTNLLYDAITALNIELEVPISDRWSVAGEWVFPWWSSCGKSKNNWQRDSKRNTFQLMQGNVEGKYWFGDRSNRPVMTGWHAGLYAGGGKYDLERDAEGYQGEFFIAAGLSGGYAHTINKSGNLRMEYSLGVGYLQTNYNHYKEHLGIDSQWHTIRQNSGTYSWFGPTRARVSLVWMLNGKVNKEK